jgi:hypothetical protein
MQCAAAAWRHLLFFQNLGGRMPTLPTRFRHPCKGNAFGKWGKLLFTVIGFAHFDDGVCNGDIPILKWGNILGIVMGHPNAS